MQIAPTYIAAFVALLVPVLTRHGVVVDTTDLATTITTIVTVLVPVFVMFRQWITNKSTLTGLRPQ